jgi:hypothetical protein
MVTKAQLEAQLADALDQAATEAGRRLAAEEARDKVNLALRRENDLLRSRMVTAGNQSKELEDALLSLGMVASQTAPLMKLYVVKARDIRQTLSLI